MGFFVRHFKIPRPVNSFFSPRCTFVQLINPIDNGSLLIAH